MTELCGWESLPYEASRWGRHMMAFWFTYLFFIIAGQPPFGTIDRNMQTLLFSLIPRSVVNTENIPKASQRLGYYCTSQH